MSDVYTTMMDSIVNSGGNASGSNPYQISLPQIKFGIEKAPSQTNGFWGGLVTITDFMGWTGVQQNIDAANELQRRTYYDVEFFNKETQNAVSNLVQSTNRSFNQLVNEQTRSRLLYDATQGNLDRQEQRIAENEFDAQLGARFQNAQASASAASRGAMGGSTDVFARAQQSLQQRQIGLTAQRGLEDVAYNRETSDIQRGYDETRFGQGYQAIQQNWESAQFGLSLSQDKMFEMLRQRRNQVTDLYKSNEPGNYAAQLVGNAVPDITSAIKIAMAFGVGA